MPERKANTSVVTNGFLLRNGVIESLNEAGLNNLTVSIDTLHADPRRFIQKSLRSLKTRLERLRRLAKFDVHVTAVLCESSKDDFKQLIARSRTFGFRMSVNLIHNAKGYVTIQGQAIPGPLRGFLPRGQAVHLPGLRIRKEAAPGRAPGLEMPRGRPLPVRRRVRQRPALRLAAGPAGKPILEYTMATCGALEDRARAAKKAAPSAAPSAAHWWTTTSRSS